MSMARQLILLISLFFFGCESDQQIQHELSRISGKHIPDKTLQVFDISIENNIIEKTLSGFTSNSSAFSELKSYADSNNIDFNVSLLPDPELGDTLFGVVNVSVTPLREKPSHASQMVDQAIMGYPVKLLRKVGDWYLCQTHYSYVGWINKTAIRTATDAQRQQWEYHAIHRVKKLNSVVYSQPKTHSEPVSDLVLNNRIMVQKKILKWCEIRLPDGRKGFVQSTDLKKIKFNKKPDGEQLLTTAKKMMGVPYLWGGNSAKGNDCSGFTQTVFNTQNIQLPRDARQQALIGKQVELYESQPGDLFFFGEDNKVKHVGICIGGKEFIHQGGKVDIHSLEPNASRYNTYRADTFLFAKRIQQN